MVRAAVVGVGYLGQFHAEKYAFSKASELVAVVDLREDRAHKIAKKLRTSAIRDYRELPRLGIQCASIASDTGTHFEIARYLLENGIDVLVEKPFTNKVREARELMEVAKTQNRILQVGHLERFNPVVREMEKVLTKPVFFEVRRIAPFKNRGHDVDVVLDLMIHDIDIIQHLVGRPIERIEAVGVRVLTKTVDIANARIVFQGGAVANVTASRAAFKSERTLRMFQPNVYISLDYELKSMKIYTKSGRTNLLTGLPEISIQEHKVGERDALRDEIESFLRTVHTRGIPEVTGEDGLRAIETAERIQEAFLSSARSVGEELAAELLVADSEELNALETRTVL